MGLFDNAEELARKAGLKKLEDKRVAFAQQLVPLMPYLLSFAAGAMMYVVVEELVPQMAEGEHSHLPVLLFSFGFTLMMTLDVALG